MPAEGRTAAQGRTQQKGPETCPGPFKRLTDLSRTCETITDADALTWVFALCVLSLDGYGQVLQPVPCCTK